MPTRRFSSFFFSFFYKLTSQKSKSATDNSQLILQSMSTDRLHTKIAPVLSEDPSVLANTSLISEEQNSADVLTYGELQTQILTQTGDEIAGEGFDGTSIDLAKSPFPINNDLFEGQIIFLLRDLPGNTYDFDGDKSVLWEIQMQVCCLCRE
jgi:hypothetical protein